MSTPPRYPIGTAEPRPPTEDLSAPATQIVRDRDDYLGQSRDVGRRLTEDQFELFVAGDPVQALQREFERLKPQYIALHDVGTASSLRLLNAMAARSSGAKVMRLSVRRQGHGMPLATLQFVEIGAADGTRIRAYSTDIDADTQARQQMARMLLAHAELGVLVVGELPPHVLRSTTQPLLDSLGHESWPCRELLLVPLGAASAPLASLASGFVAHGINAQVTPQSARPTDAWNFIGGAWNRLHGRTPPAPAAAAMPRPAPLPMQPMPEIHRPAAAAAAPAAPPVLSDGMNWTEYVHRCTSIMGVIACCVFDRNGGRVLAASGLRPTPDTLRIAGEKLLSAAIEADAALGMPSEVVEVQVSLVGHHLLLRALPRHAGVVVHALLDGRAGNVAMARAQLQRLDPP